MKLRILLLIFMMSFGFTFSQSKTLWQPQSINNLSIKPEKRNLPRTQTFGLDIQGLKQALSAAPDRSGFGVVSNVVLSFPNDEGNFERFRIYEASNFAPSLAARYPEIKSYVGKGVDDPTATIRFSVNPKGFHGMRLAAGKKASFIEPITADGSVCSVYARDQLNMNEDFECSVSESMGKMMGPQNMALRNADDSTLRTYRLAVSASGGYTQFHGGTVADALAAMDVTLASMKVPEVLFSGNFGEIDKWREAQAYKRTKARRPDLLDEQD